MTYLMKGRSQKIITISMLLVAFLMILSVGTANAQMTEEQADEVIHELEEIAHGLEHIEEYLQLAMFALIGIFLVLLGQLIIQYKAMQKK